MRPEAQRISIAGACGWKPSTDGGICWDSEGSEIITAPDYLTDLNAMHIAEMTLSASARERYKCFLHEVTNSPIWGHGNIIHATAAHRAEAFLRTIGKWEE